MITTLKITGMHCPSCKMLIEDVCKESHGVTQCTVDFERGTAEVDHDDSFDLTTLLKEIHNLGEYRVEKT